MQNKTRLTYITAACVAVLFLGGFIFSRTLPSKSKAADAEIDNSQGAATPTVFVTENAPKTPQQSPSAENTKLSIAYTLDVIWEKLTLEESNQYEFSNYASNTDRLFIAGNQKDDKTTGIIYSMKNVSDSSNKDVKIYKLPGKGSITINAWEKEGSILTFNCFNGEKGYFEITSGTVVYENYYLKILKENPFFNPDTYEFKDLNENTVKIDKEEAIIRAASKASAKDIIKKAKKISAVLVSYTNKRTPEMPETGIILENRPTWVVTFSGINKNQTENTSEGQALYDVHIFIEANRGTWLGSLSHSSLLK